MTGVEKQVGLTNDRSRTNRASSQNCLHMKRISRALRSFAASSLRRLCETLRTGEGQTSYLSVMLKLEGFGRCLLGEGI